jgi:hypothetical protein
MRWSGVVLIIFVMASTAWAQVGGTAGGTVVGVPVAATLAPIPYGFSNSVIDHNGRLLLFSVTYEYPTLTPGQAIPVRFPPTVKTRVTIIDNNVIKGDYTYGGSFQIIGVGRYAVYAINNDYQIGVMSAQAPFSMTRSLVAFGPLFPASQTLPSLDLSVPAEVKVSAVGDDGPGSAPDTIAIVESVPTPLILTPTGVPAGAVSPLPPTPVRQRTVEMFQYNGGQSFTPPTPVPIPIP